MVAGAVWLILLNRSGGLQASGGRRSPAIAVA
jgi:hypothetical protein